MKIKSLRRPLPSVPIVELRIAEQPRLSGKQGYLTILIGSNGSGKTRLLSSVAEAFLYIERAQRSGAPVGRFPLSELAYDLDGHSYNVSSEDRDRLAILRDGQHVSLADLALPKRVIALTITPHDRFPLNSLSRPRQNRPTEVVYKYLGLRDRTGRASMLSFLYTALENLLHIEGDHRKRRDRIVGVFNLLNYKPRIDITYSLRMGKEVVSSAQTSAEFAKSLPGFQSRRVAEIIGETPEGYEAFRRSLALAIEMQGDRGLIVVSADLSVGGSGSDVISQLQMLRRAGFLSIRSIEIERAEGIFVDLKEASSGELSIASTLISLAGVLEDDCIVLIDEPEISLHPEWQSSYVDTLLSTFRAYEGVHYLLATHSPLVVADAPVNATVVSLDQHSVIRGGDVAGGSVDRLLAQLFKVPTTNNLFLRDEIVRALRMAADGEAGSVEFGEVVGGLSEMAVEIDEAEPVREVIMALVGTHRSERRR